MLDGTRQRLPEGPGWPNLEGLLCKQSRGFAFFIVGTRVEAEEAVTLEYIGFEGFPFREVSSSPQVSSLRSGTLPFLSICS